MNCSIVERGPADIHPLIYRKSWHFFQLLELPLLKTIKETNILQIKKNVFWQPFLSSPKEVRKAQNYKELKLGFREEKEEIWEEVVKFSFERNKRRAEHLGRNKLLPKTIFHFWTQIFFLKSR